MAPCDGRTILHSQVEYQNKPVALTLTRSHLSWDFTGKGKNVRNSPSEPLVRHDSLLDLREVIGVKPLKVPPKPALSLKRKNNVRKENMCIETQPLDPIGFVVYVVQRSANHKWRHKQHSFQCKDCIQWINKIKEVLKSKEFSRPQRLMVFVNPCSGKRKAVKTYKDKVQPLFELAELDVTVVETEYANHARDVIKESMDLSQYDGLVCVGGDGMFSELLNGLLQRTLVDTGLDNTSDPIQPSLRIGIIPAGSTDTIVYTTTGINDPTTSAIHIIIGDSMGIDVNSVHVDEVFNRFSSTLMAYGYMGDLLKDSETNRWMGPARYEWAGTKAFLANRSYKGEVSFEVSHDTGNSTDDTSFCYSGCSTCRMSQNQFDLSMMEDLSLDDLTLDESESLGGGSIVSEPPPRYRKKIQGDFIAINGVTMSCRCDIAPTGMSPSCHLGDGCLDLILISNCSRFKFLRWLLSVSKGEHSNFNFVRKYRVSQFSFRLIADDEMSDTSSSSSEVAVKQHKRGSSQLRHSVWNCDGEVIGQPKIDVKVHCQLIKLFARGIEDLDKKRKNCTHCCSSPDTL